MEFLKRYRAPIIGIGIVVLIAAFLAFRPDKLFVDDTVDESLADAFAAPASAAEPDASPAASTTAAPDAAPVDGEQTGGDDPASSPTTTTTTTVAPEPQGPVGIATGSFYGIEHSAEGTATIYEQDGRHVLRFEDDTDIQNGPDLYVWLLAEAEYAGGDPAEYIDLGKIKGNVGGQNYELPAEYDPAVHRTVLIWCLRFTTPFAAASLA